MLTMPGFDDCIIGVCERYGETPFFVYDQDKIIAKLTVDDGWEPVDAREWLHSQMMGTGLQGVPGFVDTEYKNSDWWEEEMENG